MKLLSKAVTADKVGYTTQWVMELVKARKFPKPVMKGRYVNFLEHEVDDWIAEFVATRETDFAKRRFPHLHSSVGKKDSDTLAGSAT